ncbi:MAG: hypothetical protein WCV84_02840 [Patescibacteria group bacterium]
MAWDLFLFAGLAWGAGDDYFRLGKEFRAGILATLAFAMLLFLIRDTRNLLRHRRSTRQPPS